MGETEREPGCTDLWRWWGSETARARPSTVDNRWRWLVAALALFRWGRGGVAELGSSSGRWGSSLEGQFGRGRSGWELHDELELANCNGGLFRTWVQEGAQLPLL
jgi:hypothetical protein